MLTHRYREDRTTSVQDDSTKETLELRQEAEAISVWEIARRRCRHSRYTAALARTQGKRRQLRRLWGRNR